MARGGAVPKRASQARGISLLRIQPSMQIIRPNDASREADPDSNFVEGHSQWAIAKAVCCSRSTVERWVHRFRQANVQGIPEHVAMIDEPRPGADPKITQSIGKAILKFTEGKTNRQAPAICAHVQQKFGVHITPRRVQQWLAEQELKPYHRPKRLRLNKGQKQKRVRFARKCLEHDWTNTLFTDESEFLLHPKTSKTTLCGRSVWKTCDL